jgi:hypothetical protein
VADAGANVRYAGPTVECGPFHVPWVTSDDGRLSLVYVSRPKVTLGSP